MMEWQKPDKNPTTKYHLVVEKTEDVVVGACGLMMHNKPELQCDKIWMIQDHMCRVCANAWGTAYTSVEDARGFIGSLDLVSVQAALLTARQKKAGASMVRMLEARVRKLEKESR